MCGIVGAIAQRNITPILLEGLRRLEYRGYDSAGLAVINAVGEVQRTRAMGKVIELEKALDLKPASGHCGIAHTRWATHGRPAERNAHPHQSGGLVVVHNGIIENHADLRRQLQDKGYVFTSDTDTEVVAHLLALHYSSSGDLLLALRQTLTEIHGAYALGVLHQEQPDALYCARMGSPLVIGEGSEEHYLASDPLALLQVTDRFRYLAEGDHARITRNHCEIWDAQANAVERPISRYEHAAHSLDKGEYRHFMQKEIFEQPQAIIDTLAGILADDHVLTAVLGPEAENRLADIANIHIVACGTSYHAGLVARYWIEEQTGLPCQVEVASEYRYRQVVVPANTLLITLSQSGETADTLAVLRHAKTRDYLATLAICNVAGSSLVREADWRLLTHAGPEIGVASTKAFTTQLVALLWLTTALAQVRGAPPATLKTNLDALRSLPLLVEQVLSMEPAIIELAQRFANKHHALFLGRGAHYPIAMEGALKLKEISYIHAEAYAAGELKHGPLALVDEDMPVISVAPSDRLLEKLISNLEEVRARGGQLITFACETVDHQSGDQDVTLQLPEVPDCISPILYTLPLQLLSYHVALVKGTDVDKPRNLAKSVTVE